MVNDNTVMNAVTICISLKYPCLSSGIQICHHVKEISFIMSPMYHTGIIIIIIIKPTLQFFYSYTELNLLT
jgi:hypothetical protein